MEFYGVEKSQAGILNGCCYVGSTITSYGLGWMAEHYGWYPVFWLLFAICIAVCVIACVYGAIKISLTRKAEEPVSQEEIEK